VNSLGIEGEELPGVVDAVAYIAQLRQSLDLADLAVGRRVIVIGGGNTAIDIAVQSKLLGADEVTLVYRRSSKEMNATWKEQLLAKKSGVLIKHWAKPAKIQGTSKGVTSMEFEKTSLDPRGNSRASGSFFPSTATWFSKP